jgi:hypothetical protein
MSIPSQLRRKYSTHASKIGLLSSSGSQTPRCCLKRTVDFLLFPSEVQYCPIMLARNEKKIS